VLQLGAASALRYLALGGIWRPSTWPGVTRP